MLVLTRKPGQSIIIEGGITVCILDDHHNGQIRVGIHAPGRRVDRMEIDAQRRHASPRKTPA